MAITPHIPTIDIRSWLDPNASQQAKDDVVNQIREACSVYGFFNLVGHGIPVEKQEMIRSASRHFFKLPLEDKMAVSVDKSMGKAFRGYEPSLIQTHREGLLPDTKECFITGAEIPADHPDAGSFSTGPNLWPEGLSKEDFQDRVMEYRGLMVNLVETLVSILAQGVSKEFGCSPHIFDDLTKNPSIPMRLLYYGPQEKVDPRQFGVGDHTDFGCVSVLLQEQGTRGLEVWYPPTGTWIPVPVLENGYVINIGDTMDKWTGSYYRSARHRVVNYEGTERSSVAFFLNGNLKLNIKPLSGKGDEISISENIRSKLAHTMGKNGKFLN